MSDLTLRKCNICLSEYIPLDQVVFFQCGHSACGSCSERRSYREDSSCAECRKPKGVPHRIYLSSDDFADEPAGRIIHNLNSISADNSEGIASAGEKIRRLNGTVRGDPDLSRALLAAAKDLEDRLAPLAALYDEAKKQNEELLNRLQHLESTSAAYKSKSSREKEIARLHRDEELRLRERAQGYLSVINLRNLEITRLQTELDERDKRESLMKTKLKALAKTQRHESKISRIADTSLQVEAEPSSIAKGSSPTALQKFQADHARSMKRKHFQHRDTPNRIGEKYTDLHIIR